MKLDIALRALGCALMICLAGCASSFEKPNYAPADWGPEPVGYETTIKTSFEAVLKDPESARYRFEKPMRAYKNDGLIRGGKVIWVGYLVPVYVNAKNGFGGYTGFKRYSALLNHSGGVFELHEGNGAPLVTVMPQY
ncbi:hypothetical protein [Paracidovorax wautersii]|uniref:hypothetical protein n=1 Tax=Paracidovorax wautersii TaxID=1177982 RepID=UPI0031D6698C